MAQPGAILIDWSLVALNPRGVLTRRTKSKVPVAVGVPVMAPPLARVSPGGRFPDLTLQVNRRAPYTAGAWAEYASHSAPSGSGVHATWMAPTMFLFGLQPLKVLQISLAELSPRATLIPIPVPSVLSGLSEAVRVTSLKRIVFPVLP